MVLKVIEEEVNFTRDSKCFQLVSGSTSDNESKQKGNNSKGDWTGTLLKSCRVSNVFVSEPVIYVATYIFFHILHKPGSMWSVVELNVFVCIEHTV